LNISVLEDEKAIRIFYFDTEYVNASFTLRPLYYRRYETDLGLRRSGTRLDWAVRRTVSALAKIETVSHPARSQT
jgi:hypothetical protein